MSRVTFAALFIAAAVILTGCQGGPGPSASPSGPGTTPAPTLSVSVPAPSATPTAVAGVYKPADSKGKAENVPVPVMPELAKENSKAGLEAFIGYWFQELSYAYETGNTSQLRTLSSPSCLLCASLQQGIEAGWQDGRWIAGAGTKSVAIQSEFDPTATTQSAVVQVLQESIEIWEPNGSLYQEPTAASNSASRAALRHGVDGWVIVDLGLVR
ncbi:DUF6318 family protein [Paenarthrobacter nicotinovorans]|uniref:DUF6318 family protein n=1 Tax=Paenarthrobacter nicotinovorans TaxID=29320 RepID=UPI00380E90EE